MSELGDIVRAARNGQRIVNAKPRTTPPPLPKPIKIGTALPPIPARPAAPEVDKPFRGPVTTERFWLLYATNVRNFDKQVRCYELDLNKAAKHPRLFWRRFPIGREAEMNSVAEKLRALGIRVTTRTKPAPSEEMV